MPIVSVVTAAYNAEKFISETIKSVIAQTFTDWEYIVVDDGSTDNTGQIIQAFPEVKYVFQPNQGVSAARNTGVALSNGKYLAIIDSDDVWFPEKLEVQVAAMESQSAGLCYTNACTIDERGIITARHRIPAHQKMTYEDALVRAHHIITSSVMFSRLYLGAAPYPLDLPPCEDFFVNLIVLFRSGPGIFIDKELVYYRERPDSISHRNPYAWALQREKSVRRFLEYVEKRGPLPRGLRRRAIGHANAIKAHVNIRSGGDWRTSVTCLNKALFMNPSDRFLVARQFVKLLLSANGRIPLPRIF